MPDLRFYERAGPFSLHEIATRVGARLGEATPGDFRVSDLAPLDQAQPDDLSLFAETRHRAAFEATTAGAVLTSETLATAYCRPAAGLLFSAAPRLHYAAIARLFYPESPFAAGARRALVSVADGATVAADCRIEPGAVIADGAVLGARCRIGCNAVIARGVVL